MMGKYKMALSAEVWFGKIVEVEADSYEHARERALEIYQDADVCAEWECTHMDCDVEEYEDD